MTAGWSKATIQKHIQAAQLLDKIKNDAFKFIAANPKTNEYQVHQFILREFKKHGLVTDGNKTIVAFGASTDAPHYYPAKKDSKILKPNTLIMIDIWARLNQKGAPYADITWMGFYGSKVPVEITRAVKATFKSRDNAVAHLKKSLAKKHFPSGREVDTAGYAPIVKAGFEHGIMHTLGHSLGFKSPHGEQPGLHQYVQERVQKDLPYTIEPGIYFPGKFGIRTEIDFYIDKNNRVIVTTPVQKTLVHLQ